MGVYRLPSVDRRRVIVLAAVPIVVLVAALVFGGDMRWPIVIPVVWMIVCVWLVRRRLVKSIAVTPTTLCWRTPSGSGEVPLAEITRVRAARLSPSLVIIEHRTGKLQVPAGAGIDQFLDQLASAYPGLPIRFTWPPRGAVTVGTPVSLWHPTDPADHL